MTRPHPRTTLIAAAALASTALIAAPAGAGSVAEVSVKIKNGPPAFHGKVKSPDSDYCVSERVVKMKKERRNGGNKTLGETTTDSSGKWTFEIDPLKSGAYFAKAPKLNNVYPGISCSGARSDLQVVD